MRRVLMINVLFGVAVAGCSDAPTVAEFQDASAFRDVTVSAFDPPPDVAGWPGLALFDYDNDGDIDIFVTNAVALPNHLYQNDGAGGFRDVTAEAGLLAPADNGSCVGVGDFDNDGWLDLIVGRQTPIFEDIEGRDHPRYFKNLGPDEQGVVRFGEGTSRTGLAEVTFAMSIGVGDIDSDGLLDLYIGRYDLRDSDFSLISYLPDTPNVLLRNTGIVDGVPIFEDITASAGVAGTAVAGLDPSTEHIVNRAPTFAVYFTDVNTDGLQDIFSLQEVPGGVDLFINNGDLTFTLAQSDLLNVHGGWMGIAGGDYDRDGDLDYFLANVGADAQSNPLDPNHIGNSFTFAGGTPFHRVLENDGNGNLTDVISELAVTPGPLPPTNRWAGENMAAYEFAFGCAWFDLENDGHPDLTWTGDIIFFELLGAGALRVDFHGVGRLLRNNGDRTFTDRTAECGLFTWDSGLPLEFGRSLPGRALGAIDLNGDGFEDIVRTYFTDTDGFQCLMNPAAEGGNWITIRLEGTQSNRFGIGARVEALIAGRSHVGEVLTTTSAFTAVHPQVHFGLGEATSITALTVHWPSGVVTEHLDLGINQIVTVREE